MKIRLGAPLAVAFFALFMATDAPIGHGHVYAVEHYIDAWIEVTDVHDRDQEWIARLKQHLSKRYPATLTSAELLAGGRL